MNTKIEYFLEESVNQNVFPGCCVAIIHNQITDYYCVGNKSIYPCQEENRIDTLYDLASLSKVVGTTPAILRLIQKGLLSEKQSRTEVLLCSSPAASSAVLKAERKRCPVRDLRRSEVLDCAR